MSRVPRIRFKGFEEDWEQRKLGEVCNIITKQTGFDYSSTIKPALLKEKADDSYPFIQNKDFNGTKINMDTDFFIPIDIAEKFPNIVLDRSSILISISGRIGNVGFYSSEHKAFIGGAVGICKLKYDNDGEFIIHELESEYGQKYFYSLIKASSHANITVEDIRNMELIFPEKKEEKICISTFFSSFNHLITLHQRKLEKLKIIKKSMLENLFPQNGEKTPKIRFSGFTEDWEQRKTSDLFKITRGYVLAANITATNKSGDNPYPVYSSQTKDNGLMGYYKDYLYENAITWTTDGANAGTVNYRGEKFYCTNVCGVLLGDKVTPNQMLAEAINNVAKDHVSYVGNPKLMNNVMAEICIWLPSEDTERRAISTFVYSIDHLITLHQSKLEKLQKIKKSMLESMFV